MRTRGQEVARRIHLLNGMCPNNSRHKDISTTTDDHTGRFELTCYTCEATFAIAKIND